MLITRSKRVFLCPMTSLHLQKKYIMLVSLVTYFRNPYSLSDRCSNLASRLQEWYFTRPREKNVVLCDATIRWLNTRVWLSSAMLFLSPDGWNRSTARHQCPLPETVLISFFDKWHIKLYKNNVKIIKNLMSSIVFKKFK